MNNYIIGGNEYTREELLEFGKKRYQKFYWVKRGIGIGLMAIFSYFTVCFLFVAISCANAPEDPHTWLELDKHLISFSIIGSCISGSLFLGGLALFIVSFVEHNDEGYIKRAVKYYERKAAYEADLKAEEAYKKEKDELAALIKYKRQRDAGEISQEEYETKKKELLK